MLGFSPLKQDGLAKHNHADGRRSVVEWSVNPMVPGKTILMPQRKPFFYNFTNSKIWYYAVLCIRSPDTSEDMHSFIVVIGDGAIFGV